MRIPSEDVPQADTLSDVVRVVEAVGHGATTDYEIGEAIGKVRRQGRYYRRAAEILGWIHNVRGANRATLTPRGRQYLVAGYEEERQRLLIEAVLASPMFQRVIPMLEAHARQGVTLEQLEGFISEVTQPVGASMIPRRVSSVVNWLMSAGLLRQRGGRLYLSKLPYDMPAIEYQSVEEPLVPTTHELRVYDNAAATVSAARAAVNVLIDLAARERANAAHITLTNLVADKLRAAGAIPRFNKLIDLSATVAETPYMFEMKSNDDNNFHLQLRRAISQLYEYRFIQQTHTAKLVIVMQRGPARRDGWLVDYVVKDRGLLIVWDGHGDRLFIPTSIRRELSFLNNRE